jgi:hypothetical protein
VRDECAIYCRDQNLKFHQYEPERPNTSLQALLDHIQDSGDAIFGMTRRQTRSSAWP